MISTTYKKKIPRINIRFINYKKGKERLNFPQKAILDSGSNIHQIPKDIADLLDLDIKERKKKIKTADGNRWEKVQIADNVSFEIWGDNISDFIRFDNEIAKISNESTDILVGIPAFKYFSVTFIVSEEITILDPKPF